jgi:hypothetical protein
MTISICNQNIRVRAVERPNASEKTFDLYLLVLMIVIGDVIHGSLFSFLCCFVENKKR